jgi:carbamoyl-phosphate synthase large subunit
MGSIGVIKVEEPDQLDWCWRHSLRAVRDTYLNGVAGDSPLFVQAWVEGPGYGLDVINDLDGRYAATLVRRRIAMRSGEADVVETVMDPDLEQLGQRLGVLLGHVGPLDVDLIIGAEGAYVIDLNPRFGGSYPFSHIAGADLPRAILAWLRGGQVDPAWLRSRPGVVGAKNIGIVVVDALNVVGWRNA